jgi:hypothetical protein
MKEKLEDDEFEVDERENIDDILDEGDDVLTSRIERNEAAKNLQKEKDILDNTLEDLI